MQSAMGEVAVSKSTVLFALSIALGASNPRSVRSTNRSRDVVVFIIYCSEGARLFTPVAHWVAHIILKLLVVGKICEPVCVVQTQV
jgi:hypothetical protein